MPRGGARKGAGRKPKPLAEKLAEGNPGHRPLKKVEFTGGDGIDPRQPPDYLRVMGKREQDQRDGIPTPTELYIDTINYLETSDCLNLIPIALIADYATAKYHLLHTQYELGRTAMVTKVEKKARKGSGESYGNLAYKSDYDIGSKIQAVSKRWGVGLSARITEIEESYDRGGMSLSVTFGKPLLSLA